jgi:CspA family cold shock protein
MMRLTGTLRHAASGAVVAGLLCSAAQAQQRYAGTVKWADERKGFGFIAPNDGGRDLIFLYSNLHGSTVFKEGQTVSYEIYFDPKIGAIEARNLQAR